LGKRRRRFATRHTHSLRSDRAFSIHSSAFAGRSADRASQAGAALPAEYGMGPSGPGLETEA
jgi:hypothetical protein